MYKNVVERGEKKTKTKQNKLQRKKKTKTSPFVFAQGGNPVSN